MKTLKKRGQRSPLLYTALVLSLFFAGYSICFAALEDLQVTQAQIQGNCIILTIYNPSSDSVAAKYSASAILADGTEETRFSNGFIITPGETLQVTIEFSGIIICGGGDGGMPWPWE